MTLLVLALGLALAQNGPEGVYLRPLEEAVAADEACTAAYATLEEELEDADFELVDSWDAPVHLEVTECLHENVRRVESDTGDEVVFIPTGQGKGAYIGQGQIGGRIVHEELALFTVRWIEGDTFRDFGPARTPKTLDAAVKDVARQLRKTLETQTRR